MEVTTGDIGLVLWCLNLHGDGPQTMAPHLPDYMTVARTTEVLQEAEARGLVRELRGTWALTAAGRAYLDE